MSRDRPSAGRPAPARRASLAPLLAALAAAAPLGCAGDGPGAGGRGGDPLAPFRIVLLADSHVIGPQYECCRENGALDNESIVRTEERLAAARERINAIEPPPDLVVVLGDVTHAAYALGDDLEAYRTADNAFTRAAALYAGFEMPVHFVWGNHDYEVACGGGEHFERDFTHRIFADVFGAPPYEALDHRGFKLVLANGMLGATWERGHPDCDTSFASYGSEQLTWIAEQVAEGFPTLLFAHHTFLVTSYREAPEAPYPDLPSVALRAENVLHTFVGHTHRWIPLSGLFGVGHTLIAATRYDEDNFTLLELDPRAGTFRVLDGDKAQPFTTCARTWTYDGEPAPDPTAPETGTCGIL